MMVGRITEKNVFQVRLNELFTESDRRLTYETVAKGLLSQGFKISGPYLSQLRTGVRKHPSDGVVTALARYFGVSTGYFFTIPWTGNRTLVHAEDAKIISTLVDPALRKLLQLANDLPAESLDLLADMTTKLSSADHCETLSSNRRSYVRQVDSTPTIQDPVNPSPIASKGTK